MLTLALLAPPASALDFEDLVPAWTVTLDGQGGSDDHDEATGIDISRFGDVVVAGFRDGATGHEHDGYAVGYAPNGAISWEFVHDVGAIGPDRTSSDDRLHDVSYEPLTDAVALCGSRGAADLSDPETRFLVEAYDPAVLPAAPLMIWAIEQVDGNAVTSPSQDCRGVDWRGGFVQAAGWAVHAADEGRWYSLKITESNGFVAQSPFVHDFNEVEAVPDQALDVATSAASGAIALVGVQGFAGVVGSNLNDSDWHVRYYDSYGNLAWSDTFVGTQFLDDRATAVALEPITGDIVVAGWTNKGDDNVANADFDWLVVRYAAAGDGLGGPLVVWSQTYESAPLASEGATAIAFDDLGEVLVGGWSIDPATGLDRWRVAKLAFYDGVELQEWLGDVHAADSRLLAVAQRNGKVAMAGYVDEGDGHDFAVITLEGDEDDDGFGDSVDSCPDDPEKWLDEGVCGCNVPDIDTDYDTVFNCDDACPSDPAKSEDEGVCGCGNADTDTDGDLTPDCDDNCPDDPEKVNNDFNTGGCGCGSPNVDTDGDGILNCHDACANTPPGEEINEFGCPPEGGTGTGTGTGGTGTGTGTGGDDKGGCGCSSGGPGSVALGAIGLLALRRRRL